MNIRSKAMDLNQAHHGLIPPILVLILVLMIAAIAQAGDTRKINPPFDNKPNPFLQVLGLSPNKISLSRDSTRIALDKGGYVDLILNHKRLWRFRQYDTDGQAMDSGDLSAGWGRVHFENGPHAYDASFEAGILNGPMVRSRLQSGSWLPMLQAKFRNGLLQGELRYHSLLYAQHLASVEYYNNGMIWMSETYGRRNWLWGFLWFAVPPIKDTGQVCSRTLYVSGIPQSHECLLSRKCRQCGI